VLVGLCAEHMLGGGECRYDAAEGGIGGELEGEEFEFSDDEKEAAWRREQRGQQPTKRKAFEDASHREVSLQHGGASSGRRGPHNGRGGPPSGRYTNTGQGMEAAAACPAPCDAVL
jgi:hypothetical protein